MGFISLGLCIVIPIAYYNCYKTDVDEKEKHIRTTIAIVCMCLGHALGTFLV